MGLGDSLKKWATSKATEMITADRQKSADAGATADEAESQAKTDVAETLIRAAFPKLGEFADKQKADQAARQAAADERRRAEVAALPLAAVDLSVTGHATGHWSGQLHCSWAEEPAGEPDPADPYAARPVARVELVAEDGSLPSLAGMSLRRWAFELPGYHGDGVYDLTAIGREREQAGLTYEEWVLEFADADDSQFYFYPDGGQSTVTVSAGATQLAVTLALSGALGDLTAVATVSRPAGAAAG